MGHPFVGVKEFAGASVPLAFTLMALGRSNADLRSFRVLFELSAVDKFAFVDEVNFIETGLQMALIFVAVVAACIAI